MSDVLTWAISGGEGVVVGLGFFGGLWWTVRRLVTAAHPAAWLIGGLVVRMSAALCGFYLIAEGHWERLLACLLGFLLARRLVTWLTRPAEPIVAIREADRAPES